MPLPAASQVGASTKKQIRVAAFTGGTNISSPRFRVRQYIPQMEEYGVHVSEYVARWRSWPPAAKLWRPLWLPATLMDRLPGVASSFRADVTLLQREIVSTMVTLERFTHRPRVLDVDDAVWLNRGGQRNFAKLIGLCDGVICGNSFIQENVRRWCSESMVLPTAVDTGRFHPLPDSAGHSTRPIIGWSGLGSNLASLAAIERPLAAVLDSHKDAVLRVVSDVKPTFQLLRESQVEYVRWAPENEVRTIQEMSIGLMPMEDSLWSRGKCSYKMLLYMACGVAVAVSPVGMNNEVLSVGNVGFGPKSDAEWSDSLTSLLDNPVKAKEMGQAGRKVVEENYSLRSLTPRFAGYLRKFAGNS